MGVAGTTTAFPIQAWFAATTPHRVRLPTAILTHDLAFSYLPCLRDVALARLGLNTVAAFYISPARAWWLW